ncbi:hypothetical protein ACS0TY_027031 [Phlomoides rotata]
MRVLSYNIRGLWSRAKCKEVSEIVRSRKVDVCFIQESKKGEVDENLCWSVWGSRQVRWAFKAAEGRSSGIITLWNPECFSMSSSWYMDGAMIVNNFWGPNRIECCLINIYAACPLAERINLWDRLTQVVMQYSNSCICIAGDFNSVRRAAERAGRNTGSSRRDICRSQKRV